MSADVLLPANLGLGGIALDRQIRWRLFYDYGVSKRKDESMRAAGLGLYIPLGGNVVGKGGISFFNFSLLYVPYVKVGHSEDGKGGILFDFFGNL